LLHSAFWLVLLLSTGLGLALWVASGSLAGNLFNSAEMQDVLRAVAVGLPIFASFSVMTSVLQAEKDTYTYAFLNNLLLPAIRLVGSVLAVLLSWQLRQVLTIYLVLALCAPWVLTKLRLRKYAINLFSPHSMSLRDLQGILRFSLPLLVGSLFGLTVWQLDVLLLQRMWGSNHSGLYSAAMTIGRLPNMILLAFGFVLAPFVSHLYSSGNLQQIRNLYEHVVSLVFLVSLPISLSFVIYASLILDVVYGNAYVEATMVLRILAVGFFVHSLMGPNGNTLIMIGQSRQYLIDTLIVASVNLLLYLVLIPTLGILGAAIATLLGLLLLNGVFAVQLHRLTRINPIRAIRHKLILPASIAAGISLVTGSLASRLAPWLRLCLQLSAMFIAYGGLSVLLRLIVPADVKKLMLALVYGGKEPR
jgi:O-antigen/teichoic acid export membrane protein